eukprot:scaffold266882_cov24-Tisochrysis_lutea.AAC.1
MLSMLICIRNGHNGGGHNGEIPSVYICAGTSTNASDNEQDTASIGCIPGGLFTHAQTHRSKLHWGGSENHSRRATQESDGEKQPSRK